MKPTKQYGTLLMISAATGIVISFLLSIGWDSDLHFVANVLHIMKIQLSGGEYGLDAPIYFPTKYALAFFVLAFAVGFAICVTSQSTETKPRSKTPDGN